MKISFVEMRNQLIVVYFRYLHFCGGSAISDIYIITAAHCVVDVKIQKLWVAVGDHDTRVQDTNERVIQADKIIIHIRYNPNNFHNDIALIKLKKSFRPHNMRQTIPLMSDPRRLERELQQVKYYLARQKCRILKVGGKDSF